MDAHTLRERLARGETILMPGCFDSLSARIAAQSGFDVLFVSGYATSASMLGLPDLGYLTQTEVSEAARRICTAVRGQAAVIVDGDTGYGNPLSTMRTVELFEAAGAAGIFLEDQVWPKRCGHMAGKRVVDAAEWLAKLRAALDVRRDLFIVARTDARAAVNLDEACERARAAAALGVDAIFVEAPESADELAAIAEATPGCVRVANMIEGGRTPLLTPAELHDLGFDLIVSPLTGLLAAARQLRAAYQSLHQHGTLRDHPDLVLSFDEFGSIVELDRHFEADARYAT